MAKCIHKVGMSTGLVYSQLTKYANMLSMADQVHNIQSEHTVTSQPAYIKYTVATWIFVLTHIGNVYRT